MSSPAPHYLSRKKFASTLRLHSKKINCRNKFEVSSPVCLKLTKSSDDLLSKCHSPTLARKKRLTEVIHTLSSTENSLQKIKLAFKALNICSEEEGIYSKEMKMIVGVLENALFISKEKIESEVLGSIYEKYVETILDNGPITYMHIADGLKEVLEKYKTENASLKIQIDQEIASIW